MVLKAYSRQPEYVGWEFGMKVPYRHILWAPAVMEREGRNRKMRLDKLLSEMRAETRSEVKRLILNGAVTVDGVCCKIPKQQVDPGKQTVCCCKEEVKYQKYVYYMLHKPGGCVTARQDALHKTVMDFISDKRKGLSPVGRLDLDTEGLLLITDDGLLSHQLLSPAKHVKKVYEAFVLGRVTKEDVKAFWQGLAIGDDSLTKPAELNILSEGEISKVRVSITEGRYHQIKRMFAAVGKQVIYLKRVAMGGLVLDESLLPGEYRALTEEEVKLLRKGD